MTDGLRTYGTAMNPQSTATHGAQSTDESRIAAAVFNAWYLLTATGNVQA